MKPWELLGETCTPDGSRVRLTRQDTEYAILVDGKPLMSSRRHGSEEALATLGCQHARTMDEPQVLVGGLGMGFTLRATLDLLPRGRYRHCRGTAAGLVEWNRGPLGSLADHPVKDPRVRSSSATWGVCCVRRSRPASMQSCWMWTTARPRSPSRKTRTLRQRRCLCRVLALRAGGMLAVWSAWDDRKFEQRLRFHGFAVQVARVRARLKKGGPRHAIFVGVRGERANRLPYFISLRARGWRPRAKVLASRRRSPRPRSRANTRLRRPAGHQSESTPRSSPIRGGDGPRRRGCWRGRRCHQRLDRGGVRSRAMPRPRAGRGRRWIAGCATASPPAAAACPGSRRQPRTSCARARRPAAAELGGGTRRCRPARRRRCCPQRGRQTRSPRPDRRRSPPAPGSRSIRG